MKTKRRRWSSTLEPNKKTSLTTGTRWQMTGETRVSLSVVIGTSFQVQSRASPRARKGAARRLKAVRRRKAQARPQAHPQALRPVAQVALVREAAFRNQLLLPRAKRLSVKSAKTRAAVLNLATARKELLSCFPKKL